ncbi:MAG: hypothetical protein Q7S35_00200 [Candidatus Limnocylindrales bacterium]|nr:hypothetical protein [Candidatus Limnocylindrales bacterium]
MSVEFEPVKLGQRRRRLDPVSIGAVAVAFALAAAILKPWGGGPNPGTVAEVPPTPAGSDTLTGPHATAGSPPTWAEVVTVVHRHEAWGIRAVVIKRPANAAPSTNERYAERWFALPGDGEEMPTAQVDPGDQSIVALGVTFPPAQTPLDARIWRVGSGGLEWIDTQALDPAPSAGAFLYARPGIAGGPSRAWTAGTYRIDVLVDASIRRFGVTIPDRFGSVPRPDRWPVTETRLVAPMASDPSVVRFGAFATVDGVGVPFAAATGASLEEAEAWLEVLRGTETPPRPVVATAYLPRATGIGVMLTSHANVGLASLRRLAPDADFDPPPMLGGISGSQGRTPYVVFAAREAGAWAPGVYAATVRWTDGVGLHVRTWYVELRPGPIRASS